MLEISDLVTAYGKIEALKGVSLQIAGGRITCLLGPNGAGKTTLMMTIAGMEAIAHFTMKSTMENEPVFTSPARV